jgi:hypothetical protein
LGLAFPVESVVCDTANPALVFGNARSKKFDGRIEVFLRGSQYGANFAVECSFFVERFVGLFDGLDIRIFGSCCLAGVRWDSGDRKLR